MLRLVALTLVASTAVAFGQDAGVAADPLDPVALSRHLDRLWRSDSSEAKVTMKVVTPDYTRTLSLDVWSEGMEHTLVRITAPRKEAGVSTLKRGNEIWNYLPKIKKTIRIPPSMMMGSWMGSDLTNDDLVRESSWEDDYTVARAPTAPDGQVCLDYTPKPDAAVTWSKVTTCFDRASRLPVTQSFVDEKGREARRMRFEDVKTIGGRTLPTRLIIEPQLEKGRRTEFTYDALAFGVKHPPNTFSITRLRRGR